MSGDVSVGGCDGGGCDPAVILLAVAGALCALRSVYVFLSEW